MLFNPWSFPLSRLWPCSVSSRTSRTNVWSCSAANTGQKIQKKSKKKKSLSLHFFSSQSSPKFSTPISQLSFIPHAHNTVTRNRTMIPFKNPTYLTYLTLQDLTRPYLIPEHPRLLGLFPPRKSTQPCPWVSALVTGAA